MVRTGAADGSEGGPNEVGSHERITRVTGIIMATGSPTERMANPATGHSRLCEPPFRLAGWRIAAGGALVVTCATVVTLAVLTARNLIYFVGAILTGTLGISTLWIVATNRRFRWLTTTAAVLLVLGTVAILVLDHTLTAKRIRISALLNQTCRLPDKST